ncbi:MAG TPA: ATP-dependent helicase, partial [Accumulibacter sp.]|nr:ATP-dependent helicase [Accumulibacter sp.]
EQVAIPGFEPEYDYCYPPGDKRSHHRRPTAAPPALAPLATAPGERAPSRAAAREGSNRPGSGRRPSHIAADGFDFSKPYESPEPHPVAAAVGSEAERALARSEHPHKPRRLVAALLGGLGRK